MPLIYCEACRNQVSDQASACPRCGHPVSRVMRVNASVPLAAPAQPAFARIAKRAAWAVGAGIAGVVFLLLVAAILTKSTTESASRQRGPTAIFEATDALSDEACTVLGDYCIRVHCTYFNKGQAAGEKTVAAELDDGQDVVASRHYNLTLLPAGSQRVDFDFPEAELSGEHHYRYHCMVKDGQ